MLKKHLTTLLQNLTRPEPEATTGHSHELAAACLLLEVARADFDTSDTEIAATIELLTQHFAFNPDEVDTLLDAAHSEVRDATSLHEFTRAVVDATDMEARIELVGLMWRLAFIDGVLDKHEEALIRRVSELLYVPHSEFIRGKLAAAGGL